MTSLQPEASKLKVFVSYSRSDIGFADQLVAALKAAGITPFIDRSGIYGAEEWQKRLGQLILEADTIVFILTPDSAVSEICKWEVDEALRLGKRIIPIIWRPLGDAKPHDFLRGLNYIFFYDEPTVPGSGFGRGLVRLVAALTTDIAWIREHTRFGELATRWERDGRPADLLLRGLGLSHMRTWCDERPANAPNLTVLHREFLQASEAAEVEREHAERKQIEEMRAAQDAREKALKDAETAQAERESALQRVEAEQKVRAKSQRRNRYLVGAAALLAIGLFAGAVWQSRQTERREAVVLTSVAHKAIREGHYERAMRIAIHGLPAPGRLPFFSLGWDAPEMRGLEAKLAGAAHASTLRLKLMGHRGLVRRATFSPDGTQFVTASDDGTARIWDAESGREVMTLESYRGWVTSAELDPANAARLLTACLDVTVRARAPGSCVNFMNLTGHSRRVFSAAFSRHGARIVTASGDDTVRVWDTNNGRELLMLKGQGALSAAFSPDGTRIVTVLSDKTARVWDANSFRELLMLKGQGQGVLSAAFSPDGTRIVTATLDKTAQVWDARSGQPLLTLETGRQLWDAGFSRDGNRIVTISSLVRIWDARSGQPLLRLEGGRSAAFSPDGSRIVTASRDGMPRVFEADSGREILKLVGHESAVWSVSFSPDGRRIVTASADGTARVWDASSGHEVLKPTFDRGMVTAAFSIYDDHIVTGSHDKTAQVWDAKSGEKLLTLVGHTGWVVSAAFSPDGSRIVTTSWDKTARVWDANSGQELVRLAGHTGQLGGAVFSPDGTRIVTASWDKTARVWDANSGEPRLKLAGHGGFVQSAAFGPDGSRIVTASRDKTARVWDATSGREVLNLTGHGGSVWSAAFSSDGSLIVTASEDRTARVWDARSGQEVVRLTGSKAGVSRAVFSPDGSRIVTASSSQTGVWDAKSGQDVLKLESHGAKSPADAVWHVAFSPDGTRIIAYLSDGTARVWSAEWLVNLRGSELGRRACEERLIADTELFTARDATDPILSGLSGTNPCERRGPLSFDYWRRLLGWN